MPTNDDFCPKCGNTFPRDQRDFHLLVHYEKMNQDVLQSLENIRKELSRLNPTPA